MITHEEAKDMVTNNIIEWFRKELVDYIKQQEQFAKDVARYFYLENLNDDKHTIEVAIEHHALKEKLSKVGKEWN